MDILSIYVELYVLYAIFLCGLVVVLIAIDVNNAKNKRKRQENFRRWQHEEADWY